jgi:hypothetical protein
MRSYLDGSLRMAGRLRAEEHFKKCSLCTEALQGYRRHGQSFLHSDLEFLSKRVRRKYSGKPDLPGRRLPVLILFSLVTSLLILLGIFYIIRQDETNRQVQSTKTADSTLNEPKSESDTTRLLPTVVTGKETEKDQ